MPAGNAGDPRGVLQRLRRQHRSVPEPGQYRPGHAAVAFAQLQPRRALGAHRLVRLGRDLPERVADEAQGQVPGRLRPGLAGFLDRGAQVARRCDPRPDVPLRERRRRAWQRHDEHGLSGCLLHRREAAPVQEVAIQLRPEMERLQRLERVQDRVRPRARPVAHRQVPRLEGRHQPQHHPRPRLPRYLELGHGRAVRRQRPFAAARRLRIPAFGDPQGPGGHPGADRRCQSLRPGAGLPVGQGHGDRCRFQLLRHQAERQGRYQLQPELHRARQPGVQPLRGTGRGHHGEGLYFRHDLPYDGA